MSFQAPPRSPRPPAYGGTQWFTPPSGPPRQAGYADQASGPQRQAGYADQASAYQAQTAPPTRGWAAQPVMSDPVYATATPDEPPRRPRRPGVLVGAMTGLLAAALAVGVATLAAAFVRPQSSPLIAVGEPFVNRVPQSLMNLAVQHFGGNDNTAAFGIVAAAIAVVAMIIGVLAVKQPAAGVTGIILIAVFSAFAVITRPMSHPIDVIPSVIGGVAGIAVLMWLIRASYAGLRR
jgi:hypothetical protein